MPTIWSKIFNSGDCYTSYFYWKWATVCISWHRWFQWVHTMERFHQRQWYFADWFGSSFQCWYKVFLLVLFWQSKEPKCAKNSPWPFQQQILCSSYVIFSTSHTFFESLWFSNSVGKPRSSCRKRCAIGSDGSEKEWVQTGRRWKCM